MNTKKECVMYLKKQECVMNTKLYELRQNSTGTPDAVLDVNPQVWPVMATGYIEACQPLPWRQSFDPGPYAWTCSGWRQYGSPSDETETASLGSDETEPAPKGSGAVEGIQRFR